MFFYILAPVPALITRRLGSDFSSFSGNSKYASSHNSLTFLRDSDLGHLSAVQIVQVQGTFSVSLYPFKWVPGIELGLNHCEEETHHPSHNATMAHDGTSLTMSLILSMGLKKILLSN